MISLVFLNLMLILYFSKISPKKFSSNFIMYFTLAASRKRLAKVYFLVGLLNCSLSYLRLQNSKSHEHDAENGHWWREEKNVADTDSICYF